MRNAKVDENQSAVVDELREIGCSVQLLHAVGKGCPDILVGRRGVNILMEIKDGAKPPSARKLTGPQEKFHGEWRGQVCVVTSGQEAVEIMLALTGGDIIKDLWSDMQAEEHRAKATRLATDWRKVLRTYQLRNAAQKGKK